MNKLLKSILFILSVIFTQGILAGILVNDVDINTITTPKNGVVVFDNSNYDNMAIVMLDGKVMVYSVPSEELDFIQNVRDGVLGTQHNKEMFRRYTSSNELLFSFPNVSFEHFYLKGAKRIVLNSSMSLALRDVVLESPSVFLKSDTIEVSNCLIDGSSVQLESNNKNSFLSIIKLTFKDKRELLVPTAVKADVCFNGNDTEIFCFATGVSKVEIQFLSRAFNYNNSCENKTSIASVFSLSVPVADIEYCCSEIKI